MVPPLLFAACGELLGELNARSSRFSCGMRDGWLSSDRAIDVSVYQSVLAWVKVIPGACVLVLLCFRHLNGWVSSYVLCWCLLCRSVWVACRWQSLLIDCKDLEIHRGCSAHSHRVWTASPRLVFIEGGDPCLLMHREIFA
jgi:hypothetical protein